MQPQWKTLWRLLKKWKIELSHDITIPLMGISKENENINSKIYAPVFIAASLTIAEGTEAT